MNTPQFNIGDTVWIASHKNLPVRKDCPICFGKQFVTLILGDDSEWQTPCQFCGKGYDGPRGWIEVYEWQNSPFKTRITGLEQKGDSYEYKIADGWADPEDILPDEQQALERCAVLRLKHEAQEQKNLESRKEYDHKDYSWHVGYHRCCLAEAHRQIAYHEKKVIYMGLRAEKKLKKQQPSQQQIDSSLRDESWPTPL